MRQTEVCKSVSALCKGRPAKVLVCSSWPRWVSLGTKRKLNYQTVFSPAPKQIHFGLKAEKCQGKHFMCVIYIL